MQAKSPKQQLNVIPNPEYQQKIKSIELKQQKKHKPEAKSIQLSSEPSFSSPSPKKRQQLKHVQDEIELMKNKVLLLKIQLQKEQQSINIHKSRTEDIIRKKINVNKVQKYKVKDTSLDIERAEQLRARNASLRESHQSQMQNIFKAIYLVKLDDAREIKNLSKSHRKKILQMNEATYNQQVQKKKKITEDSQRAKQKYERYWKQKLSSIYENENKNRPELDRAVNQKRDELKQLREQEIKLLETMNKVQSKQVESKKQYLAALSLPVKDVAEALNRSKSSLENSNSIDKSSPSMLRVNSEMNKSNKKQGLTYNLASMSGFQSSVKDLNESNRYKQFKVPNSNVNKEKLAIVLKQLKRLEKKERAQKESIME